MKFLFFFIIITISSFSILFSGCAATPAPQHQTVSGKCSFDTLGNPSSGCYTQPNGVVQTKKGYSSYYTSINKDEAFNGSNAQLAKQIEKDVEKKLVDLYKEAGVTVSKDKLNKQVKIIKILISRQNVTKKWRNSQSKAYTFMTTATYEGIDEITKGYFEDRIVFMMDRCFDPSSADIKNECVEKIKNTWFFDVESAEALYIETHSAKGGNADKNQKLTQQRGRVLADLIQKEYPYLNIYYVGYGDKYPLMDTETPRANQINERETFLFLSSSALEQNKDSNTQKFIPSEEETTPVISKTAETVAQAAVPMPKTSKTVVAKAPSFEEDRSKKKNRKMMNNLLREEKTAQPQNKPKITQQSIRAYKKASIAVPGLIAAPVPIPVQVKIVPEKPKVQNRWANSPGSSVDFGGNKSSIRNPNLLKYTGKLKKGMLNFFSDDDSREAAKSCIDTSPVNQERGKNEKHSFADNLPGLYGKAWIAKMDDHLVGIDRVAVLSDGRHDGNYPNFLVFENHYIQKKNKPTQTIPAVVNTYLGEKGLLYRMYFNGKEGLQCADIIMPVNGKKFQAVKGDLYYIKDKELYVTPFVPHIVK